MEMYKAFAWVGITCFLITGLLCDGWKTKSLSVIFAISNYIIFLK